MTMPTKPAIVHLVCGALGAGKTTFSLALARKERAIVFSIDDWMARLFGPDISGPPQWPWIAARVARCEAQILETAIAAADAGLSVILDIGLLRADRRREIADLLRARGLRFILHVLEVDAFERWRRVRARNETRGATYRLDVTRPMFDFIETLWQPPQQDELDGMNGSRVA